MAGRRAAPKKQPQYVEMEGNAIVIGSVEEALHVMDKDKDLFLSVWDKVDNAKDFVVKLRPLVIPEEELAGSNYNGSRVFNGKEYVVKDSLPKKPQFLALMAQTHMEFPDSMGSAMYQKQLKDAINGKCRKIAMKQR